MQRRRKKNFADFLDGNDGNIIIGFGNNNKTGKYAGKGREICTENIVIEVKVLSNDMGTTKIGLDGRRCTT